MHFQPSGRLKSWRIWERCIQKTCKVMKVLSQDQPLHGKGLLTLLCEVESIIDGRPFTKVSDNPRDPEALTPNHLLLLRSGPTLPLGSFAKDDNFSRHRWRQVQYLADVFWHRWVREYLPTLLVPDESTPRCLWPLGRVLEVHQSRDDGLVRSVKVKTRTSVLTRPIEKRVLNSDEL